MKGLKSVAVQSMKLFKNWEQVNDGRGDALPYLSGASDKVVFQIQVGQTGLLKVSLNSYMEILANQEALLAH